MNTPLRDVWWNFRSERLEPVWTVKKNRKTGVCEVWSHHFGWELRLVIASEVIQSQVVRSPREFADMQDQWKTAMLEKGWTP
jgi:hypothetical protein